MNYVSIFFAIKEILLIFSHMQIDALINFLNDNKEGHNIVY